MTHPIIKSMFNLHLKECELLKKSRLSCLDPKLIYAKVANQSDRLVYTI